MQADEISWIVEPQIPRMVPIKYTLAGYLAAIGNEQHLLMNSTNHFFASLTNVSKINFEEGVLVADLTTSLTVVTDGLENGTNITCSTLTIDLKTPSSSSFLYMAGLVS